ncbi:hypothetical protein, conserved [Eimeria maxima]|uniref:Uncharacterized protein n=1 Tax=Eimeria maxima TaxID=5804 RepID=U6M6E5_EIMMA|nr:hypothetical protein, conserved [Eimeria maxima]CDJ59807.1 hypothetical protein, conserved [Eimeria maxima]
MAACCRSKCWPKQQHQQHLQQQQQRQQCWRLCNGLPPRRIPFGECCRCSKRAERLQGIVLQHQQQPLQHQQQRVHRALPNRQVSVCRTSPLVISSSVAEDVSPLKLTRVSSIPTVATAAARPPAATTPSSAAETAAACEQTRLAASGSTTVLSTDLCMGDHNAVPSAACTRQSAAAQPNFLTCFRLSGLAPACGNLATSSSRDLHNFSVICNSSKENSRSNNGNRSSSATDDRSSFVASDAEKAAAAAVEAVAAAAFNLTLRSQHQQQQPQQQQLQQEPQLQRQELLLLRPQHTPSNASMSAAAAHVPFRGDSLCRPQLPHGLFEADIQDRWTAALSGDQTDARQQQQQQLLQMTTALGSGTSAALADVQGATYPSLHPTQMPYPMELSWQEEQHDEQGRQQLLQHSQQQKHQQQQQHQHERLPKTHKVSVRRQRRYMLPPWPLPRKAAASAASSPKGHQQPQQQHPQQKVDQRLPGHGSILLLQQEAQDDAAPQISHPVSAGCLQQPWGSSSKTQHQFASAPPAVAPAAFAVVAVAASGRESPPAASGNGEATTSVTAADEEQQNLAPSLFFRDTLCGVPLRLLATGGGDAATATTAKFSEGVSLPPLQTPLSRTNSSSEYVRCAQVQQQQQHQAQPPQQQQQQQQQRVGQQEAAPADTWWGGQLPRDTHQKLLLVQQEQQLSWQRWQQGAQQQERHAAAQAASGSSQDEGQNAAASRRLPRSPLTLNVETQRRRRRHSSYGDAEASAAAAATAAAAAADAEGYKISFRFGSSGDKSLPEASARLRFHRDTDGNTGKNGDTARAVDSSTCPWAAAATVQHRYEGERDRAGQRDRERNIDKDTDEGIDTYGRRDTEGYKDIDRDSDRFGDSDGDSDRARRRERERNKDTDRKKGGNKANSFCISRLSCRDPGRRRDSPPLHGAHSSRRRRLWGDSTGGRRQEEETGSEETVGDRLYPCGSVKSFSEPLSDEATHPAAAASEGTAGRETETELDSFATPAATTGPAVEAAGAQLHPLPYEYGFQVHSTKAGKSAASPAADAAHVSHAARARGSQGSSDGSQSRSNTCYNASHCSSSRCISGWGSGYGRGQNATLIRHEVEDTEDTSIVSLEQQQQQQQDLTDESVTATYTSSCGNGWVHCNNEEQHLKAPEEQQRLWEQQERWETQQQQQQEQQEQQHLHASSNTSSPRTTFAESVLSADTFAPQQQLGQQQLGQQHKQQAQQHMQPQQQERMLGRPSVLTGAGRPRGDWEKDLRVESLQANTGSCIFTDQQSASTGSLSLDSVAAAGCSIYPRFSRALKPTAAAAPSTREVSADGCIAGAGSQQQPRSSHGSVPSPDAEVKYAALGCSSSTNRGDTGVHREAGLKGPTAVEPAPPASAAAQVPSLARAILRIPPIKVNKGEKRWRMQQHLLQHLQQQHKQVHSRLRVPQAQIYRRMSSMRSASLRGQLQHLLQRKQQLLLHERLCCSNTAQEMPANAAGRRSPDEDLFRKNTHLAATAAASQQQQRQFEELFETSSQRVYTATTAAAAAAAATPDPAEDAVTDADAATEAEPGAAAFSGASSEGAAASVVDSATSHNEAAASPAAGGETATAYIATTVAAPRVPAPAHVAANTYDPLDRTTGVSSESPSVPSELPLELPKQQTYTTAPAVSTGAALAAMEESLLDAETETAQISAASELVAAAVERAAEHWEIAQVAGRAEAGAAPQLPPRILHWEHLLSNSVQQQQHTPRTSAAAAAQRAKEAAKRAVLASRKAIAAAAAAAREAAAPLPRSSSGNSSNDLNKHSNNPPFPRRNSAQLPPVAASRTLLRDLGGHSSNSSNGSKSTWPGSQATGQFVAATGLGASSTDASAVGSPAAAPAAGAAKRVKKLGMHAAQGEKQKESFCASPRNRVNPINTKPGETHPEESSSTSSSNSSQQSNNRSRHPTSQAGEETESLEAYPHSSMIPNSSSSCCSSCSSSSGSRARPRVLLMQLRLMQQEEQQRASGLNYLQQKQQQLQRLARIETARKAKAEAVAVEKIHRRIATLDALQHRMLQQEAVRQCTSVLQQQQMKQREQRRRSRLLPSNKTIEQHHPQQQQQQQPKQDKAGGVILLGFQPAKRRKAEQQRLNRAAAYGVLLQQQQASLGRLQQLQQEAAQELEAAVSSPKVELTYCEA